MIEELPPLTFNGDIVFCFHFFNQKIGVIENGEGKSKAVDLADLVNLHRAVLLHGLLGCQANQHRLKAVFGGGRRL